MPLPALANTQKGSARLPRKFRPQMVKISSSVPAGEIHVSLEDHFLYWTLGDGKAMRYGIAVGAPGRNLTGTTYIRRKAKWPRWVPTRELIQ